MTLKERDEKDQQLSTNMTVCAVQITPFNLVQIEGNVIVSNYVDKGDDSGTL